MGGAAHEYFDVLQRDALIAAVPEQLRRGASGRWNKTMELGGMTALSGLTTLSIGTTRDPTTSLRSTPGTTLKAARSKWGSGLAATTGAKAPASAPKWSGASSSTTLRVSARCRVQKMAARVPPSE